VPGQQGLGRTFLAAGGVGVLVTLVGDVLEPLRGVVGAQDLPVETGVFLLDAAVHGLGDQAGDFGGSGELDQGDVVLVHVQELSHDLPLAGHEVDLIEGETAGVQESHELVEDHRDALIHVDQGGVAHEQGTHDLEHRDLEREVEGRDHHHGTIGVSLVGDALSGMVAGAGRPGGEEADAIATVVGEKRAGHAHLATTLGIGLGHHPLDELGEEVLDLLLGERFCRLFTYPSEHEVAFLVLAGVVPAAEWAVLQVFAEGRELLDRRRRDVDHGLSRQRINDPPRTGVPQLLPVSVDEIPGLSDRPVGEEVVDPETWFSRIDGCKIFDFHFVPRGVEVPFVRNVYIEQPPIWGGCHSSESVVLFIEFVKVCLCPYLTVSFDYPFITR